MVKYMLKMWKVDDREKTLVVETTFDSQEDAAEDIAEQAGSAIQEAVECNG